MAEHAAGNARFEHHRHLSGRHLARTQPFDRAFACAAADHFGFRQIAGKDAAGVIVIAFHAGAVARHHSGAKAVIGAAVTAGETVARDQRYIGRAGAGLGAFGIGDALDRARRVFGRARVLAIRCSASGI